MRPPHKDYECPTCFRTGFKNRRALSNHKRWHNGKYKGLNQAESNGMWKGDQVGYGAIHDWARYHIEKPSKCSRCGKSGWIDLANISQKYLRDLTDWEWLCRKCHMLSDNRLNKLTEHSRVGEHNGRSILTADDVAAIRSRTDRNGKQLAAIFGVNARTISAIRKRKIWRHIT